MSVGRCSSKLSGHKLQSKLKKSQPPTGGKAKWSDLLFLLIQQQIQNGKPYSPLIPSETEGSAILRTIPGNVFSKERSLRAKLPGPRRSGAPNTTRRGSTQRPRCRHQRRFVANRRKKSLDSEMVL